MATRTAPPLALLLLASFPVTGLAQEAVEATTIGGYGEVQYSNHSGKGTPGEVNLERFVVYLAHAFSDRISRPRSGIRNSSSLAMK